MNNIHLIDNEPMPPGGVKELSRSSDGRRYLAELQRRHKHEIVQPRTDPNLFNQLYGAKLLRQKEQNRRNVSISKQMWEENNEKKLYAKTETARRRAIFV